MAKHTIAGKDFQELGIRTIAKALVKAEGGDVSLSTNIDSAVVRLKKLQGGEDNEALSVENPQ